MTQGYFGSTEFDRLRVDIRQSVKRLKLSLSSEAEEFLNLGAISVVLAEDTRKSTEHDTLDTISKVLLSSNFSSDSQDITASFKAGRGLHSKMEKNPHLIIEFKKTEFVNVINVNNRADYWGIRSSTLSVSYSTDSDRDWVQVLDLGSPRLGLAAQSSIARYLSVPDEHPRQPHHLKAYLCACLEHKKFEISRAPWQVAINLTDLSSPAANEHDIKIWAAFLAIQYATTDDSSVLHLLNPVDAGRTQALRKAFDAVSAFHFNARFTFNQMLTRKATVLKQAYDWARALQVYELLLEDEPHNHVYLYGLAACLENTNRYDEAKLRYTQGLSLHPDARPVHKQLMDSSYRRFEARAELCTFVEKHLDAITTQGEHASTAANPKSLNKIFCYWAQGFENSPPMVKACQRQLHKYHSSDEIVLISEDNYQFYVDIPDFLIKKTGPRTPFFSDILRIYLLCAYGGTWIDATCYLTGPLNTSFGPDESFTAFQVSHPARLSVWYLKGPADSYLLHTWKQALLTYWTHYDEVIEYFIFHNLFEALYFLDPSFKRERDRHKQVSSSVPHAWYYKMSQVFDPDVMNTIVEQSNIHKLTYKIKAGMESSNSFYSHAIRGF